MVNPRPSRRTVLLATGGTLVATQLHFQPAAAVEPPTTAGFAHPGLLHSADDLDRMRAAAAHQRAPQYDGFRALAAHPRSSYDYVVRNAGHITSWGRGPANFMAEAVSDSCAAYQNALMWAVTGDVRHADKARDILNAWSGSLETITGADGQLGSGLQGFKFVNAAELLRHTGYTGWAQADVERCAESFRKVWYRSFAGTALFANGNWDLAALQSVIAIAVFCDDRVMFENAVRYAVAGAGNGRIEHIVVEATGQGQESGRSQAYAQLALGLLADTAAVAWNQGVDLFGHGDDRILKGFEYTARYNLVNDVPFTADLDRTGKYLKTAVATGNRGQFQPIYELAYGHYVGRRGLRAPYLEQVVFRGGSRFVEGTNDDHPGWGTLTQARDHVPPSTPEVPPGTPYGLTARHDSNGVVLAWARSVEPRSRTDAVSYTVKRATDGAFTTIAGGLTATSFVDSTTKPGRTYYYTVEATNAAGISAVSLPVAIERLPWASTDIGTVRRAGRTDFDGRAFVIEAGGADLGGTQDSFRFSYVPMVGDGTLTARVVHPVSSQYASVGVMMRQSLDPGAAHASMLVKGLPLHTWSGVWTVRPETGAPTTGTGSTAVPPTQQQAITINAGFPISDLGSLPQSATPLGAPYVEAAGDGYRLRKPYWVRIVREGNRFTGYLSPDGTTWTEAGSSRLRLGQQLYVGLAVCSTLDATHAETTTAAFDNVTAPGWSVRRPDAVTGALSAKATPSAVELTWTDLDVSARSSVHRSTTPGGPYKVIARDVAGYGVESRYRDATGVPGTTYYYAVAKTNVAGAGPCSAEATATMPAPPAPEITSAATAYANVGKPFHYRIAATNDPTSYSTRGLPGGLATDPRTGIISGTPSAQGVFTVTVTATNATAASDKQLVLTVAAPPPAPWAYRDLGDYVLDERRLDTFGAVAVRTPGITSYADGRFVVRGAGSDLNIINQGMTAQYASVLLTGDRTITARVVSSDPGGRIGLLMAKSLSPFDQVAGVILTGDKSQFVRRLRVATTLVTTETTGAATWLRLRRTGDTFAAETSADGASWTPLAAPAAIAGFGDAPYHAGLAVVSRNPFALNTTVFDHVSIS
ncbi:alginate lyase family protein [Kribbella sp. HUAS MG21]|uniref:Alginate lyase family protein n=1 Tax=Kribbella sp. HUAS MG21 TaxID=3160966 RepID=A0AAU7TES7_9ACTN